AQAPTQSRTTTAREPRAPSSPVVGANYKLLKDHVLMSAQRHTMALIPLVLENSFKIIENALPVQAVREESPLTWTPYFETVTTAKSSTSIIVTLVLPVNDPKEAEEIVKTAKLIQSNSNEIEVSVNTSSGSYKWVFAKEKDGYVLKD
ncbi:MAG: hypothetical protein NTZ35_07480, partial [Ignavibacteriales bacterium]|nr:hypothetical protein [Ignavibacteriales bacterium]